MDPVMDGKTIPGDTLNTHLVRGVSKNGSVEWTLPGVHETCTCVSHGKTLHL